MSTGFGTDFEHKVVVVTGGAKGVGEATVRAFHRAAARVAILDVDRAAGTALATELSERAAFVACDVGAGAEVEGAFREVADRFGGVDVLVNNAGIQRYGTVVSTTEEAWDEVLNVNLRSAFLCARRAVPMMLARGGGVVVNVASVQSFITQPNVAAYATSKAALLGLTRSIAVDFAPTVRCVAVCPGTVDTPMLRDAVAGTPDPEGLVRTFAAVHPSGRIGRPEEVAGLILFLAGDAAGFMTGQAYRIDGGLGISIVETK